MTLTKEECEKTLELIKESYRESEFQYDYDDIGLLEQLINEHFKLVELLKKHKLENLSIKELDAWFDRSLWHVNKVNELSNQLVECQRVAKQKQERIEELTSNPPLKFEELKENMWVWDNKYKEWCYIYFIAGKYPHRKYIDNLVSDSEFEENRFYRREVKE